MKIKQAADREKFTLFLKTVGYSGKQLGPMKFENLFSLYEIELKKWKAEEERKRYEMEKLLKASYDVGARVVKMENLKAEAHKELRTKAKLDSPPIPSPPSKRRKQMAKTGPHKSRKTTQPTSTSQNDPISIPSSPEQHQHSSHEEQQEDLSLMIIPETSYVEAVPLQSKPPRIVDWEHLKKGSFWKCKVTREDLSTKEYGSFIRMLKEFSREEVLDLFHIGMNKFQDKQRDQTASSDANHVLLRWLKNMFIPEQEPLRESMYSPINRWTLYENCGVYSFFREDATQEYYLVEKKYPHGLVNMERMMEVKLVADINSKTAADLIWKIRSQMREELQKAQRRK